MSGLMLHEPSGVTCETGHLEQFLRVLWPNLDGRWLLFWGAPSKKSDWAQTISTEVLAKLETWAETENVYLGCGLRAEHLGPTVRGDREAVVAIPGLWIDVDFAGAEHRKPNLPPSEADARRLITELGLPPTLLIHTGYGLQAWWCFREPWILETDEDRTKAESLTKGWCHTLRAKAKAHGWDVDQVGDLARVMRLPGLWNRKGVPKRTGLLSCDDAIRYNPDDFEPYLLVGSGQLDTTPNLQWDFDLSQHAEPPAEKFLMLCEIDTQFKLSWLHGRNDLQDQSASSYDLSLATRAFAANWSAQEIVNLLVAHRRKHNEDLKLRKDYYERTLTKANSGRHVEEMKAVNEISASTGSDSPGGLVKDLADTIVATGHFAQDRGHLLYVFEGGVYRPHGDEYVARRVKNLLEESKRTKRWSSHLTREVTEYIRVDAPLLWDRPPLDVVNVQNGLLKLACTTLAAHSPTHLSSIQIPVHYDPTAACPEWERFVQKVFPSDCRSLAYDIPAYLMLPNNSFQKAFLCIGKGRNGKSTFLKAVTAFLGRDNVTGLSLQKLEVDKFAVARLLGKLANICPDLPSDHLSSTSIFKGLTGCDRMSAERKFQTSFEFEPFARLLFSTNHYPQSRDGSDAFFQRWVVIPFDVTIPEAEKIPDLDARLSIPRELSGLLNRALVAWSNLRQRHGFTQSESVTAASMEFRETTDPLAAWLDQCTVLATDGMVTKKDLLIAYNASSKSADRPLVSSKAFYGAVKQLRPTITEAQRRVHGDVQWVFLGLSLSQVSRHSRDSSEISLENE